MENWYSLVVEQLLVVAWIILVIFGYFPCRAFVIFLSSGGIRDDDESDNY